MLAALIAAAGLAVPAGAAGPPPHALSGPRALADIDLSGTWSFTPQGQARTTIEVPGGGWYKQGFTRVARATYERQIEIPAEAAGQTVLLELGAVNHEATVAVDGQVLGTRTTSFTEQVWDLTGVVRPGQRHTLSVDIKGREALLAPGDPRPGVRPLPGVPTGALGAGHSVPTGADWCESIAQGIFGTAPRLRVMPAVRISDAFVRPSASERRLDVDVWIANGTGSARTAVLSGGLSAPGGQDFDYPEIPVREVSVPAGETVKVTLAGLPWREGPSSFWWPNVPYRPGYRAVLHDLSLELEAGGEAPSHTARYRFGMRDLRQRGTHYELNGVRVNLRGDTLTPAIYDRVDYGGKGDAMHTLPGFLPPSAASPGWPQAVDNYQRLNMNVVRIHGGSASHYMFETADEMGLMIIGETAIRGSENKQDFTAEGGRHFISHLRDTVRRDRNHASIVRWSQSNEPDAYYREPGDFQRRLYDALMEEDATRPISADVTSNSYEDLPDENFTAYQHYVNENGSITFFTEDVHPREDRPFGRGEFVWPLNSTPQGFMWFATATQGMRLRHPAEIRPYSLAGAWGSVVPGVRRTDYLGDNQLPPLYGEDNLPRPWENRQVRRIQAAFHPLLVSDPAFWNTHKLSDPVGSWPVPARPVLLRPGTVARRQLAVFNDTLADGPVEVRWEARLGSPAGERVAGGSFSAAVAPGGYELREIEFAVPRAAGKKLHLVLESGIEGLPGFRDDAQAFVIG